MTDYRSDTEHHLQQATLFTPGSEHERYHTHTASIFASLTMAEAQRQQAMAAERMADVNERLFTLMAAPQPAAPAEEATP